ncbi:Golgi-associated olfactory signaling regulator isoform X2 [Lissotriton helveticus]
MIRGWMGAFSVPTTKLEENNKWRAEAQKKYVQPCTRQLNVKIRREKEKMRTTLNTRLLSGIILFIIHTGIRPTCSLLAYVSSTGSISLPTTVSEIINSNSTSSILLNTTQDHGNASAEDILLPAANDIYVSSAMETTSLFASPIRGVEKTPGLLNSSFTNNSDILGFIVPLISPGTIEEEFSNNTVHATTNLAPGSGTNSSGTDQMGSSEFWNNITMTPPNMTEGSSEDTYEHRTKTVEMKTSTIHYQTIYSHKNGVRKKAELKGPFLKEQPRVTGKMLVLFFGIVGALVCLLILIYVIYSRTNKSEMFSHHRLYGEGFEDPVLHLDTPMDYYDFFSFSDTHEHSPHTLQKLRKDGGEVPQPPADLSQPTRPQEAIQLESLTQNKNFV